MVKTSKKDKLMKKATKKAKSEIGLLFFNPHFVEIFGKQEDVAIVEKYLKKNG